MQSINLPSLIIDHCIFGILHRTIPDNSLVHNFHNLTDGLVQFL